jgi:hypothetical protein
MTDRFASLKSSNNTFKKDNSKKRNPPPKNNTRFDSLDDKPGNRFVCKKRTNRRFYRNRDNSNNNVSPSPNIGKFTQVGTGEVSFTPQYKNKIKKDKKLKKLKEIKKEDNKMDDIMTAEERAFTLALAEQYQYYTESEEEEYDLNDNDVPDSWDNDSD